MKFPNVIQPKEINCLREEYAAYRCLDIAPTIEDKPVDQFWVWVEEQRKPGTSLPRFPLLAKLCQALCVLPHGNADCERIFSMVRHIKTEFRHQLGNDTEQALLAVNRNGLQNKGVCCYEVQVDKKLMKEAKMATTKALDEYQKKKHCD